MSVQKTAPTSVPASAPAAPETYPELRALVRDLAAARAVAARHRAQHLEAIQAYEALQAVEEKAKKAVKTEAAASLPVRTPLYDSGLEIEYAPSLGYDAVTLLALCPEAANIPGVIVVEQAVGKEALGYAVSQGQISEAVADQAKCRLVARNVLIKP